MPTCPRFSAPLSVPIPSEQLLHHCDQIIRRRSLPAVPVLHRPQRNPKAPCKHRLPEMIFPAQLPHRFRVFFHLRPSLSFLSVQQPSEKTTERHKYGHKQGQQNQASHFRSSLSLLPDHISNFTRCDRNQKDSQHPQHS